MYVAREVNPANAKNLKQLENKIRTCLSNMDQKDVQVHAKTVSFRLDIMRRHGYNLKLINSNLSCSVVKKTSTWSILSLKILFDVKKKKEEE
ncbi:hypothetical protein BpHYR1_026747 [Brachionus plicatilis]|uniref:Uncharacterized protein n=1 Tax=Brachionus plicatilis TaxID=10195 RepID=A0A3M7R1E4_BRAPC|nr:hypothetical protein BpHYR1_026747 [Brachionus plicatilis]